MEFKVSNSKIKTWRRCPKRYEYKYIQKLETRKRSVALERGSWLHELLQTHYDGEDWREVHKEWSMRFYNMEEEDREDLGHDLPDEIYRIFRAYLKKYKEIDKSFVVVDSEMNEYVDLGNGLVLNIIIDLIVEDKRTKLLWAWDHKSRKNFENSDNMILDPQLTLYFSGLQKMGYSPLGGVLYNEIRTKPPTIPRLLKNGGLSKAKDIDTDVFTYMSEIRKHDLDPNDYRDILRVIANKGERFFRRVALPKDPPIVRQMTKEAIMSANEMIRAEKRQEFPRSFDVKTCKWDCDFKDVCIVELHGADPSDLIRMNFRKRGQMD